MKSPDCNTNQSNNKAGVLNYLSYVTAVILKPFETFKEEEQKLSDTKTSIIFSCIVAGAMMLINLIKSMISVVFVKQMNYSTFKTETKFVLSNLKDLKWFDLIVKQFFIYALIFAAVAGVFYVVALIFKKQSNFIKNLSITTTSMLPYIILGMVASPLLGMLWGHLSAIAVIVGLFYTLFIFVYLINDTVEFENNDLRIYYNAISMSVLLCIAYFAIMKSVSSALGGYLSLFG